jgi:transcriptional regulator with XRE-family HTH domain
VPNHLARELILTIPLREDRGLDGNGGPKVRRFRSFLLALGPRLRAFRREHDLTQAEVARALGLSDKSTITGWEKGTTVPDGVARERLVALLDGRLWPEVRRAMVVGEAMPQRWLRAVRWYRRASRERCHREAEGVAIAARLAQLRDVGTIEDLRQRYAECDEEWAASTLGRASADSYRQSGRYRAEDTAHGLRCLEIAEDMILDLRRSLVPQISSVVLERIVLACGVTEAPRDDD